MNAVSHSQQDLGKMLPGKPDNRNRMETKTLSHSHIANNAGALKGWLEKFYCMSIGIHWGYTVAALCILEGYSYRSLGIFSQFLHLKAITELL